MTSKYARNRQIYAEICSLKYAQLCQNMQLKYASNMQIYAEIGSTKHAIICKYMHIQ